MQHNIILQMPLQFYVQNIISTFYELEIRKRMHFEDLVFNYHPFVFTLIFRFTLFFYLHEVYTLLHNMFKVTLLLVFISFYRFISLTLSQLRALCVLDLHPHGNSYHLKQ